MSDGEGNIIQEDSEEELFVVPPSPPPEIFRSSQIARSSTGSLPALPSLPGSLESGIPEPGPSAGRNNDTSDANQQVDIELLPQIVQSAAQDTLNPDVNVVQEEIVEVDNNVETGPDVVENEVIIEDSDSNDVIEIVESEESATNTENESSSRETSRSVTPQNLEGIDTEAEGRSVISEGIRSIPAESDSPADFRVPKRKRVESSEKETDKGDNQAEEDDDEGNTCSICFDSWTSSGSHRIASLKCGHLFGQSCIEKWLKGQNGKCPQCNAKAKRQEIRVLYAKSLKALDTTERDQALKDLEKEKEARKKVEMAAAQTRLQYQLATQDCHRLQTELDKVRQELKFHRSRSGGSLAASESSSSNLSQSQLSGQFILDKTIKIWEAGNCRVMSHSGSLATLVVSQPSSSPLFPGFGVKKISTMDFKTSQYLTIHSKAIRDVCFHPLVDDGILLSCGLDKTVKMTSIVSNAVVQTYDLDAAVWSCVWNLDDRNLLYAGLQNGKVLEFDIRNTQSHVQELNTEGNRSVVSLQYVPKDQQGAFRPGGLLVGQQDRVSFYEKKPDGQFRLHMLPLEGILTSLCFEPTTRHVLASFRPTAKHPTIRHQMCELVSRNISMDPTAIDSICSCNIVHTIHSSRSHTMLSKTKIIPHPADDNRLMMCAGEESSNSVHVWDTGSGQLKQKLPTGGIVVDICSINSNQQTFLAALTSKQVKVFKWS